MDKNKLIFALILACFLMMNTSLGDDETEFPGKLINKYYLDDGLRIDEFYYKYEYFIPEPKTKIDKTHGVMITGKYIGQSHYLFIENHDKFVLRLDDYPLSFSSIKGGEVEIIDVIMHKNNLHFLHKRSGQIFISTVLKTDNGWDQPVTREITQDIGCKIKCGKLHKTETGIYALLYYYDNLNELWLVSTESPILLWANKGNKKGREHEFRKEDRIKAALLEYKKTGSSNDVWELKNTDSDTDTDTDSNKEPDSNESTKNENSNKSENIEDSKPTENKPAQKNKNEHAEVDENKSTNSESSIKANNKSKAKKDLIVSGSNEQPKIPEESDSGTYESIFWGIIGITLFSIIFIMLRRRR